MKLFKTESEKLRDQAHKNLIEKLSARRKTVYQIIKSYGKLSGEEVADKMKLRLNEVSGRITELNEMRLLKYVGSTQNTRSKQANSVWGITTPEERELMLITDLTHIRAQIYDLELDLNNVVTDWAENLITKEIKRLNRRLKLIE